jgi:hypothetical protein
MAWAKGSHLRYSFGRRIDSEDRGHPYLESLTPISPRTLARDSARKRRLRLVTGLLGARRASLIRFGELRRKLRRLDHMGLPHSEDSAGYSSPDETRVVPTDHFLTSSNKLEELPSGRSD